MKNTFKLFGMMLLAGALALASCTPEEEENNGDNTTPGGGSTETTYSVKVNCNDATMGTVAITPDSASYHAGTELTITATPNAGHKFTGWSCGNNAYAENPYTFTVSENAVYTANFQALPPASWNATFDGSALDIAGYSDFQCVNRESYMLWLAQFAKNAEGTSVYFPYIVMWMASTSQANLQIYTSQANPLELYYQTYYSAGNGTNYGDWQYYATENMNCTAMDLTDYVVSFTGAFTMYDLGEIVNETHEEPADCTKKTLNITGTNLNFVLYTGKGGLQKMNVK